MRSQTKAIAFRKPRWKFAMQTALALVVSIVLNTLVIAPTLAQLPLLPGGLQLPPLEQLNPQSESKPATTWITLDGRRVFQIAAQDREALAKRVEEIQPRFDKISQNYFQSNSTDPEVKTQRRLITNKEGNPTYTNPEISINNQRLLTVTDQDAQAQGENDPQDLARTLRRTIEQDLIRAKQERQPEFIKQRGTVAAGILMGVVLCSWLVRLWQLRLQSRPAPVASTPPTDSVTTQLTQQQQHNLQEVRRRLFQLAQACIWGSGTLIILGLFPYTRVIQFWILTALNIPFLLVIVGLGTYVVIRLSYVLIDKFTTALANNALLGTQDSYVRIQLRVMTISGVTKSIATLAGVVIGTLLALSTVGVNIVPLIAGAGLIGVAISLASQSLIKDAINGFLIIMEDQYAIGDVIHVGDLGGMVENLNLRITQVRDAEGRLITIPNSEIKTVANLSSRWSRVDLIIPIAYDADVDHAMKLIDSVGLEMDLDPQWQEQILERPQVLGVDNFGDRGLMIRVWIKTQPLKQWDVAREFRRRLKIAFDAADIAIPVPQQAIWLNTPHSLTSQSNDNSSFVRK